VTWVGRIRGWRVIGSVVCGHAVVMVGLALLGAGTAAAWNAGVCNHQNVRWAADEIELGVMQCSAPPGSHRAADLLAGIDGWNSVPGLGARLEPEVGAATCRVEINRRNELAYVRPDQLDAARAVTRMVFDGPCAPPVPARSWPAAPHIVETDVLIADFAHDLVGPPARCDRSDPNAPVRRALVLHEIGHILGLLHEDDHMAVMNTTASSGRYCGVRAIEPHPDDRAGARRLYPAEEAPVRDVAAIAFHLTRPGYARGVVNSGDYRVCPGQPLDVRWAVANQGTVDAHTSVQWFISDNDIISRRDHLAGTSAEIALPAGAFRSGTQTVTVPDLPRRTGGGEHGPWWVGFVVDPDGSGVELPASNDWTYTQMRVWLRDPGECP